MQVSVVVSYYKNIPNLELILLALNRQTAKGTFEVILSEDDNAAATQEFINKNQNSFSFPLIHISQPDEGFRKCRALNNAVKAASADFIIFIDGDCIPHRHFIKQYISKKKYGRVLYGRRVMLGESISTLLLQKKELSKLHVLRLLFSGSRRIEEGFYLPFLPQRFIQKPSGRMLGCNMGLYKDDLVQINGFDEDYTSPGGGEDSDIEWRIKTLDHVSFYSMKLKAIVYHIWHEERFTVQAGKASLLNLLSKKKQGSVICKNGLKKL